ncbi:MAG: hypothetical protein WBW33_01605 [Bryobacteraceae bacterium]
MPPKVELGDPADLFFGLHDLAARIRTLSPDEHAEWIAIVSYINAYIEYLSSLTTRREPTERPLSGGMEQGVIVAIHALETARRCAEKRAVDSTADAVRQASRAIGSAGDISLPSIAVEK